MQARYVAGLYDLEEMGPLLRRQAGRVGMEAAEVWVALTDGGNGLEEFCRQNFARPDLVVILDFYHAASYLEKLAQALFPHDADQATGQAEQWCRLLKEEGGAATLAVLENAEWPAQQSATLEGATGNDARVFYEQPASDGVPGIQGSGLADRQWGGRKRVQDGGGAAAQGAGMRWSEAGAHARCHVRALVP